MRAFESKNPEISSSERTKNVKSKTIFKTMRTRARECNGIGKNYTGTMIFGSGQGTNGQVTNYRSYDLANTMARGAAVVWDNCCQGITGQFGNPEKQFEGWNANGIEYTSPGAPTNIVITVPGGADPDPGATLPTGASGLWIDPSNNLFGTKDGCNLDKFLNFYGVTGAYQFQKGNNTRNNYMVGYQQIGGNKNRNTPWLLYSASGATGATCCKA